MNRQDTIKKLESQLRAVEAKARELKVRINEEKIADFLERNGLTQETHFKYDGKECVGVFVGPYNVLNTRYITKQGELSKNTKYIKPGAKIEIIK